MVGRKFERLFVPEQEPQKDGKGRLTWKVLCDCGNILRVKGASLRNGNTKSCGCLREEVLGNMARTLAAVSQGKPNLKNRKRPYEWLYNSLVSGAKERRIPCSLTYEEFFEFTKSSECHYCGAPLCWPPSYNRKNGDLGGTNLDRKENKEGYFFRNLVACCLRCNRGKCGLYSYEEWLVMTAALRKYRAEGVS